MPMGRHLLIHLLSLIMVPVSQHTGAVRSTRITSTHISIFNVFSAVTQPDIVAIRGRFGPTFRTTVEAAARSSHPLQELFFQIHDLFALCILFHCFLLSQ